MGRELDNQIKLAVFVGSKGRGSNLMAAHSAIAEGHLQAQISVVIGSQPDAPALERARDAGLKTIVFDPKSETYAEALTACLAEHNIDTIVLAGYLRRLPSAIVQTYRHKILNIHPALLPAFGGKGMYGLHVQKAVLDYGVKVAGCTSHLVDEEYDTGPIICQRVVEVLDTDTPETLAARILPEEHAALVQSLQWLSEGKLTVTGRVVTIG
jgi:phosphoribosylglycinamide formyltransferase 1